MGKGSKQLRIIRNEMEEELVQLMNGVKSVAVKVSLSFLCYITTDTEITTSAAITNY